MNEQKQKREDRQMALHHAVQDRLDADSDAKDIVKAAEAYLEFLRGDNVEES